VAIEVIMKVKAITHSQYHSLSIWYSYAVF